MKLYWLAFLGLSMFGRDSHACGEDPFTRAKPSCLLACFARDDGVRSRWQDALENYRLLTDPDATVPGEVWKTVEYETGRRHYSIVAAADPESLLQSHITGPLAPHAAVLFLASASGLAEVDTQNLGWARRLDIETVVVVVDTSQANGKDATLVEWVQFEHRVRAWLTRNGFAGNNAPVVRGDLRAVETALAEAAVGHPALTTLDEFWAAVDLCVPQPLRAVDEPFLMPVEDVFSMIQGGLAVATGRVEQGEVRVGAPVEILGYGARFETTVTAVQMFQKTLHEAEAGDNTGLGLQSISKGELKRGMVLGAPGTLSQHTECVLDIYMLSAEEGGLDQPWLEGRRAPGLHSHHGRHGAARWVPKRRWRPGRPDPAGPDGLPDGRVGGAHGDRGWPASGAAGGWSHDRGRARRAGSSMSSGVSQESGGGLRALGRSAIDFVFGYDFFVSYAHGDGRDYPAGLRRALEGRGYRVFFDLETIHDGDDLGFVVRRFAKATPSLVVLAGVEALRSKWVAAEIAAAQSKRRRITAVEFDGALASRSTDTPEQRETKLALSRTKVIDGGSLTAPLDVDDLCDRLARAFKETRQDTRRARAFLAIAAVLLVTSLLAFFQYRSAERQRQKADQSFGPRSCRTG